MWFENDRFLDLSYNHVAVKLILYIISGYILHIYYVRLITKSLLLGINSHLSGDSTENQSDPRVIITPLHPKGRARHEHGLKAGLVNHVPARRLHVDAVWIGRTPYPWVVKDLWMKTTWHRKPNLRAVPN